MIHSGWLLHKVLTAQPAGQDEGGGSSSSSRSTESEQHSNEIISCVPGDAWTSTTVGNRWKPNCTPNGSRARESTSSEDLCVSFTHPTVDETKSSLNPWQWLPLKATSTVISCWAHLPGSHRRVEREREEQSKSPPVNERTNAHNRSWPCGVVNPNIFAEKSSY